jgi:hypothetical protein
VIVNPDTKAERTCTTDAMPARARGYWVCRTTGETVSMHQANQITVRV